MAEARRVEFKTISATNGDKKDKNRPLSQRFTLALGESTATTCPEFSFTELAKKEKRSQDSAQEINPDDPFGEENDHDEVAALARKFEEKYGPKPKKKLKCLEDEYYDLGEGYDENDPFIDNTEAYDEVVPSCLTTQHGGFYINRGTLDFRTMSDQDDSAAEFTPSVKKRGRPRKILGSDSEQEGGGNGEPKKKRIKKKKLKEGGLVDGVEGEKKKKKKRITVGPDGEIIMRRKPIDPDKKKKTSPTVAELLKQQTASTSGIPNGNFDDPRPATPSMSADFQADKSIIQDRIEAVICEQLQDGQSQERKTNGGESGGPNNLPTDLPLELAQVIDNIKQAAKDTTEGKCKFFSGNVNKMLLDIELGSRQLALGKRSSIYAHLADYLPCGKETLIKRAKKLRENQQDDQLKGPIHLLKKAISDIMPSLQEQHEQEVLKYRMENKEKADDGGEGLKEEGANTESDDEEKLASDGPSRKGNRGPRKKFKWMPEIKKLLCQIVLVKMQMFDTYKIRNQTSEEYLKTFLDNEIKPLWPQGWIQTRMLFKESRSVHGSWTNPLKPKKPVLVTKSAGSPQTPMSISPENVPDIKPAKTPGGPVNMVSEVIELSDNEDQHPTPIARRNSKVNIGPMILDIADDPKMSGRIDPLSISPNSVVAMAAAAAAAVSSQVTPQAQQQSGDRRQRDTLVTEILRGINSNALGMASMGRTPPVPGTPTTPPTQQGKDAVFSPFLAEFDRYLNNRQSVTQAGSSTSQGSLSRQQLAQQVQSKTVSSSTGKSDATVDGKVKQLSQIKWQMDNLLSEDKARRISTGSVGASSPLSAGSADILSAQQAHYKKMYSLLNEPATPGQKTKSDQVRDEILNRIQAEMVASNINPAAGQASSEGHTKKTAVAGASESSPTFPGHVQSRQGKPTSSPAPAHTSTNQRHSIGGGSIPPAHQSYPQAASGSGKNATASGNPLPLLSASGDRGNNSKQGAASSAFSPKQVQASPPAARSSNTGTRPSGYESPHRKLPTGLSLTSGHVASAFQRNTTGQIASKPQNSQVAGQNSPGQRSSANTRHTSHSQGHTSPIANQSTQAQKSQAAMHSVDGTRKSVAASPSGPKWADKILPGGGSKNVSPSGSNNLQGMGRTLFEQIESQIMEQAALEQKGLQNLALAGALPPRSSPSGLLSPFSAHGRTQVSPTSLAQLSGSQSGGKSLSSSPLPAHTGLASLPAQGHISPRQATGLYNPRPGMLPAYSSLHSHTGPLYKDNSKPPH